MSLCAVLLLMLSSAAASSDGWTPIIPESSAGSGPGPGRHGVAVEPGLPGSLASTLASSLAASMASLSSGSFHSQVDHLGPPGPGLSHGHSHGHSHAYRPPRPHPSLDFPLHASEHPDTCSLYKAAMTQDLYFQYIQYKVHMPDLKEFTLCMWHKFYNHSSDHPLFSYAIRDTPRAILSWVTATDRSTYFSMSVDGHTLFRLNYPLRLNRWYHSCQSWNGRTGEWQVWVNAERVGRGFHNLLVNHVIKGGGVAITGQEQRQYGGGFLEGDGAPKGSGGMLGEITQLQMYTVALTAGKAYRDHKHHHGNYNNDVAQPPRSTTTTPAPQPETTTLGPYAPFITNGQLTPQLPIFELSAFRKNIPMPMEDAQQTAPSAAPSAAPTATASAMLELSQLLGLPTGLGGLGAALPSPAVSYLHMTPSAGGTAVRIPLLTHPRPALNLDPQQHYLFKRDDTAKGKDDAKATGKDEAKEDAEQPARKVKRAADEKKATDEEAAEEKAAAELEPQRISKHSKRDSKKNTRKPEAAAPAAPEPTASEDVKESTPAKRELNEDATMTDNKKKRQTISLHSGPVELGGDLDTSLLGQGLSGLLPHGELLGAGHGSGQPVTYFEFHGNNQQLLSLPAKMQAPSLQSAGKPAPQLKRENEPAEGEVMAVMAMCSGCAPDPFAKVNVISWQGTPKKLYSGVLYLPAKPVCRKF